MKSIRQKNKELGTYTGEAVFPEDNRLCLNPIQSSMKNFDVYIPPKRQNVKLVSGVRVGEHGYIGYRSF